MPHARSPRRRAFSAAFLPAAPSPPHSRSRRSEAGDVILAMLPDTGERYFTTFLFEGVNEGSDDEWLKSLG